MGTMMTTCCSDESPDYSNNRNLDMEKTPLVEEFKESDEMGNTKDEMEVIKTEQDDYYQKCIDLTVNISSSINTPTVIEHDSETHTNNWNYINSIAQVCEESLNALAKQLVGGIGSFSDNNNYDSDSIKIIKTIKDEQSAKEEVEKIYNGNWLRVVDACKETIIHNDFKELYFMLLMLAKYNHNCCGFDIISIKQINKTNICVLVEPVQYSVDDDDENQNGNDYKKEIVLIDMKCTEDEENILVSLKMNMSVNDDDDDEPEDEEEFLNLPAHICQIEFIHKAVWDANSINM
eukprot:28493_1